MYSPELQEVLPYGNDYSPVKMCNKAVFHNMWWAFVFAQVMLFLRVQFCVAHALCQSAVPISSLYMSCCPVPPVRRRLVYPVLESALCKNTTNDWEAAIAQSVLRLATRWTVRDRIPVGSRYSALVQTGPGAHPASYTMGTGSFPGERGRGVSTTHLHLAPRLKKE